MNSSDSLNTTQDIHDNLVAYLDGELDAETARRVDDLLSTDPQVRKDVAELDASWNLLERLPRTELGENFTRTTLELVAEQAEEQLKQSKVGQPKKRIFGTVALIAAMFLAGVLGVFVADWFSPNKNAVLLENLPVIQQLDQLEQVGDFEFLQQIHEQNLFQLPPEEQVDAGGEVPQEQNGQQGG